MRSSSLKPDADSPAAGRNLLAVVAIVLALLGGYVAAYVAMVRPAQGIDSDFGISNVSEVLPLYAVKIGWKWRSSQRLSDCFAPIHWLDRRLRPQLWDPIN